jgi:hypothetical protein
LSLCQKRLPAGWQDTFGHPAPFGSRLLANDEQLVRFARSLKENKFTVERSLQH